jgi:hypothetical protein
MEFTIVVLFVLPSSSTILRFGLTSQQAAQLSCSQRTLTHQSTDSHSHSQRQKPELTLSLILRLLEATSRVNLQSYAEGNLVLLYDLSILSFCITFLSSVNRSVLTF